MTLMTLRTLTASGPSISREFPEPRPSDEIDGDAAGWRDAGANSISKVPPRARAVARNRSPLFLMHFSEDAVMYGS